MSNDLRDDWADLLQRRQSIASSLVPYMAIIDAWAQWQPFADPLEWERATCAERWGRGVPLLGENALDIEPDHVEEVLAIAMEAVTAVRPEEAQGMRRLADEWDAGRLRPAAFLPTRGAIGEKAAHALGIRPAIVAFLGYAGFRPAVAWALRDAREGDGAVSPEGLWSLGVCPFCGAPPGFGDIVEDGRLRLSCHVCAGTWIFSRVRCPLCGADGPRDLARLEAGGAEEAYFIAACTRCKGYVKQIDRRQRWNARSPVVEDWGSPHLDLAAKRAGYWHPIPTLLELVE